MANDKNIFKVTKREKIGSNASRRIRKEGRIPVVIYGHGKEPKHCVVSFSQWNAFSKTDNQIAKIFIDSSKSPINALVKDVQFDYLSGKIMHIDFQEINLNEEITTTVAIEDKGTPIGVSEGGILNQSLHEIEISCLANNIPDNIEVDVSNLSIGDSILIKDIKFPEGVECLEDPETTVFYMTTPTVTEEATEEESEETEEAASKE